MNTLSGLKGRYSRLGASGWLGLRFVGSFCGREMTEGKVFWPQVLSFIL